MSLEENENAKIGSWPIYIFIRKDMFYQIHLRDDADAIANAEINPGTLRVEDIDGRVVWRSDH